MGRHWKGWVSRHVRRWKVYFKGMNVLGFDSRELTEHYAPYGVALPKHQKRLLDLWNKQAKQVRGSPLLVIGIDVDANKMSSTLPDTAKQRLIDELLLWSTEPPEEGKGVFPTSTPHIINYMDNSDVFDICNSFRANPDYRKASCYWVWRDTQCELEIQPPYYNLDVGGTSTDFSRFDGRYEVVYETTSTGVTIQSPQLDINTIASGGGSCLTFLNGLLLASPHSAGADPGPTCYRWVAGTFFVVDMYLIRPSQIAREAHWRL